MKATVYLLLLSFNLSYSQILLRIEYFDSGKIGYYNDVLYSIESLDELKNMVYSTKKFKKENSIFNSFGTPITDYAEFNCANNTIYSLDYLRIDFKNLQNSKKIVCQKKNKLIEISLMKGKYELCEFNSSVNLLGGVGSLFVNYIIVLNEPEYIIFNDSELCQIKKIPIARNCIPCLQRA